MTVAFTAVQRLAAAWGLWRRTARAEQLAPLAATGWLVWLILAGRGWGKTRTGAEQAVRWALEGATYADRPGEAPTWHPVRIALVAATFDDGRDVMVEGDSGIESVLQRYGFKSGKVLAPGVYKWDRSLGQLRLPNGSMMDLYSGNKPRQLRGPQHHYAWCDELPHWQYPRKTWQQVRYGLRLGDDPKVVVTTTPLPIPLLRELVTKSNTVVTKGATMDNAANLADTFLADLLADLDGTTEGRQELYGELLDDVAGALLTRKLADRCLEPVEVPELDRLVTAVDPAVEDDPDVNDATGLAVVGAGYPVHDNAMHPDQLHLYVLHADQLWESPEECMRQAGLLWDGYVCDTVVIEKNNGGKYLPAVLKIMAPGVPFRTVFAKEKKMVRARPLVALAEQGRLHLVGECGVLVDELTTWTDAAGQPSPNVTDAVVWGQQAVLPPQLAPTRKRREAALHG